jgi:putative phosphoserine phosphatase/1-acylglycerol-3-phosphate O-acyltransferase
MACFDDAGTLRAHGSSDSTRARVAALAGTTVEALEESARQRLKQRDGDVPYPLLDAIRDHRRRGHLIVIVSGAPRLEVIPLAQELGADHVLCTEVEIRAGCLTGEVAGEPLEGEAASRALAALAHELDCDLAKSWAYADGADDLPLLRAVGNPVAVEPDPNVRHEAADGEWPVLAVRRSGRVAAVTDLVRTTGFYAALGAGLGLGAAVGALNRSRAPVMNLGSSLGAEAALAAAGVDVHVAGGEEHLWSSRPCVFAFNHQSKIDPIIVMKLLRGGFTGVAKKEAKDIPFFGVAFQLAGVAFVDRGDPEQARRALEPAVAKLRAGTSLIIAPEGTRSVTPRLGPFKKGAFHIAMQAGVPIVPIVLRNAGEVMWRSAQTVSPGRVDVRILEPVGTTGWRAADLDDHVRRVRERFEVTLADWEHDARRASPSAPGLR